MSNKNILYELGEYPPRYGPEWGSGGIFGLKYYRGILYYTLAFEAESHFIGRERHRIYRFELVGSQPVSGGDTYNAVDTVDEKIYFGGWVHAPAIYKGRSSKGLATISFRNKYSHVHEYDVENDDIKLLWKESIHDEDKWTGEISDIIYDPYGDRLLLARGDGHVNLGIYSLDRRNGKISMISNKPVLRGSLYLDHACFGVHVFPTGTYGIECVDLIEKRIKTRMFNQEDKKAIDGGEVIYPVMGDAISAYGRYFLFVRGGVYVGNLIDESLEPLKLIRLMDFGINAYGPFRTVAKPLGGGIIIAYNAYTNSVFYHDDPNIVSSINTIVGPSVLLYISPPTVRIIGAYGARITGIERVGGKLVLATNTMANLAQYDVSPFDMGYRGFIIESISELLSRSPPITYIVPSYLIGNNVFGGIPLSGYKYPRLIINASMDNELIIYSYNLSLPVSSVDADRFSIRRGINIIELDKYRGLIVSFEYREFDRKLLTKIILEN